MICSDFVDKRQYRREAIIRWKLKRKNYTSASKFAIFISGETSKVFSDVLIDKKQYRDVERGNGRNVVSTVEKLISPVTTTSVEHLLDMEENVLANNSESAKYVSVREYYAYKLQICRHDKSHLLHFGRLLQQYIVDSYVELETQRLAFYRT
uniref:Uncharacterized protein n=1 Tax=Lactuca sativa TaxID=4236 RepID=A0A9R1XJ11_LACSA|nr:hypothetical protein LSAT_V11C300142530 [Lactuca sativa]